MSLFQESSTGFDANEEGGLAQLVIGAENDVGKYVTEARIITNGIGVILAQKVK